MPNNNISPPRRPATVGPALQERRQLRGSPTMFSSSSDEALAKTRSRPTMEITKRSSVFGSRSRSETVTSTTSSYRSMGSSVNSMDTSSKRSSVSQDSRYVTYGQGLGGQKLEKNTGNLFGRNSRMLRRQGSKMSMTSGSAFDEIEEEEKRRSRFEMSDLFRRPHSRAQSEAGKFSPSVSAI